MIVSSCKSSTKSKKAFKVVRNCSNANKASATKLFFSLYLTKNPSKFSNPNFPNKPFKEVIFRDFFDRLFRYKRFKIELRCTYKIINCKMKCNIKKYRYRLGYIITNRINHLF